MFRPPDDAVNERGRLSSEHLLAAVSEGDEAAFEVLYDRLAVQVFGLIRRVLRDAAQSEEVMQEVFLEVWRSAPSFDSAKGTASTWILTIAHRRAVDRVRSAQATSDREDRVGRQDLVRPYDIVSEAVERRLEQQEVRRALLELTDAQRQALQLAYYGGYTQSQVAKLLGIPLGTAKGRIRDALIRLRDVLEVTA